MIKGPEAKAGFTPNLSKISGVSVPIIEANKTTEKSAIETTMANDKLSPINTLKLNTSAESTQPLITATNKTRNNLFKKLLPQKLLFAKLCTTKEED